MFTRKRFVQPVYTAHDEKDIKALGKAVLEYLLSLEGPEALTITKATIDSTPIGADDPSTGAFTTLSTTGALTQGNLTASLPVIANASKQIVSASQTGTGTTFVMSAAPSLSGEVRINGALSELRITDTNVANADWSLFAQTGNNTVLFRIHDAAQALDRLRINSSGHVLMPYGFGYGTGSGGAVTQLTNKSTGVTLNTICGAITMNNAALAAATAVGFTFTNSTIAATDTVIVSVKTGTTAGAYIAFVTGVAAGSCVLSIYNATGGSLSEAVIINFAVVKAVAA